MDFPVLQDYLQHLAHTADAKSAIWQDRDGRAIGRYFNCKLTSVFQPIRLLDSARVVGFEGLARGYFERAPGLHIWRLLDSAASDTESIELDRLCRMLHAINFYRQAHASDADLFLSVHDRLLAAVDGNHGAAFRRILDGLGLPVERIVLQLPAVKPNQGWLLSQVADNYRRNGFRIAVNTANAAEALDLLGLVWPDVIKVDAREVLDEAVTLRLLQLAQELEIRIIFKRLENPNAHASLLRLGARTEQSIYAQGHLWDLPHATVESGTIGTAPPVTHSRASSAPRAL
jgi:EAL domain-containing protein (putative c-di-GMP-specific phosphodiesterase class I)